MAVDNSFTAYLSTDPNTLGTQIGSGTDWLANPPSTVSATSLGPGTYYIQVIGTNSGSYAGFLGQFNLDGTQILLTDTNWAGNLSSGSWSAPTGTVTSFGTSASNSIWLGFYGGPIPNIDNLAEWIWADDAYNSQTGFCQICTVNFMASFTVDGVSPTPLPGALPLFTTGLGALGLLGWRRKKKAAALAA